MASISQEIVESTSLRVGEMPPRDARRAMERAAEQQPALLAYVMAATQDERPPVHELAIYAFFVFLILKTVIDLLDEAISAER